MLFLRLWVSFCVFSILCLRHFSVYATPYIEMGYKSDGLSMYICMVNGTHCCSAFLTIEWQQIFRCCFVGAKGNTVSKCGNAIWHSLQVLMHFIGFYPVNMPTREYKMHCESEFSSFCSPFFTRCNYAWCTQKHTHNSLRFGCRNAKSVPLEKRTHSRSNKCTLHTHIQIGFFSIVSFWMTFFDVFFLIQHSTLNSDTFIFMYAHKIIRCNALKFFRNS